MMTQRIIQTGKKELVSRPNVVVQSNTFDLSHDHKTSFNIGELIPYCWFETLPGDIIHCDSEALVRLAPMLAPVMQRMNLRLEFFHVANRISYNNWEKLISPPVEGGTPPAMPTNEFAIDATANSIFDYLGLPIDITIPADSINMLLLAAVTRIWYDWYADENFTSIQPLMLTDGATNDPTPFSVKRSRLRDRDYFTALLPWPQKGADVVIPVTVSSAGGTFDVVADFTKQWNVYTSDNSNLSSVASAPLYHGNGGTPLEPALADGAGGPNAPIGFDPAGALSADLSGATFSTTGTINDLRTAAAVQRWLEADSFGTRYIELIYNHFGTTVEDFRMQRAEFLGSSIQPIIISEVLQTSQTGTTPLADMAGHGISTHRSNHYSYHVKEHGYFIIYASVLPTNTYFQGIHRSWFRRDRLDFAWPELANIGYQEVLTREIYYQGISDDDIIFGYCPRYQEYRTMYNRTSADFSTTLNYWHLALDFTSRPTLTDAFQYWNVDETTRIFAVTTDTVSHVYAHFFNLIKINRKLPRFSIPRLM